MRFSSNFLVASLALHCVSLSRGFAPRATLLPSRAQHTSSSSSRGSSRSSSNAGMRGLQMSYGLKDGDVFWAKELRFGMPYRRLGKSELVVSKACLGTMTWGEQNTEQDAFEQLDFVFDHFGVNFIDTAEIYPVPIRPETQGLSEKFLGKWLKTRTRQNVVVATKMAGRSDSLTYLRDDGKGTRVNRKNIIEAVDKSLQRLGTDYIDLLQIHWPDRPVPLFGSNERFGLKKQSDNDVSFQEQLEAFDEVVKAGKVRHIGTSNDTPYGVLKMASLGERQGLPRVASVQNNYSLLCRAEVELGNMPAAVSRQAADIGFLAYSPLAGGMLTGKYADPDKPVPNARLTKFKGFMDRYQKEECFRACKKYDEVAYELGLTPTQFAMAWVYTRTFITSTVIGGTNLIQLRDNLRSMNCPMQAWAESEVNKVYEWCREPTRERR